MLQFHAQTFTLLNKRPAYAPGANVDLAGLEERLQIRLPASLWEWYSMEDALAILNRHSNADPALPPHKMYLHTLHDGTHRRYFLTFRHENQGVCTWAVELDGSDDPPVFVDFDSNFQDPVECGVPFSVHVYGCVWDWSKVLDRCFAQAQNPPLTSETLAFLHDHFTPGPFSRGWPGDAQHRFSRGDQCVLIWSSPDQADWHLAAQTPESLMSLAKSVWDRDNLKSSLWSHIPQAAALINQLRQATSP